MAYRNKTFISFASEDLRSYRLMTAWKANERIDFNFHDAHELHAARDTSLPDTIRRRLTARLANTKQVVLLVGDQTRSKAGRASSFIHHEVEVIRRLELPVVFAHLNQSRRTDTSRLPAALVQQYSISVSFQPAIIRHVLDDFPERFAANLSRRTGKKTGPYHYKEGVYSDLGL